MIRSPGCRRSLGSMDVFASQLPRAGFWGLLAVAAGTILFAGACDWATDGTTLLADTDGIDRGDASDTAENSDIESADNSPNDAPEGDPDGTADLRGTWAWLERQTDEIDVGVIQEMTTFLLFRVVVREAAAESGESGGYEAVFEPCRMTASPVLNNEAMFPPPMLAYSVTSGVPLQSTGEGVEVPDWMWTWGLRNWTDRDAPLPLCRTAENDGRTPKPPPCADVLPQLYDQDEDGFPGVTVPVRVGGVEKGKRYTTRRAIAGATLRRISPDVYEGVGRHHVVENVVAATSFTFLLVPQLVPLGAADKSRVAMRRVADTDTCEDLRARFPVEATP